MRVVAPALFVATKLDAFHGRGGGDIVASHDLEDIIAVVDGRPEIVSEVAAASTDVRVYIASHRNLGFTRRVRVNPLTAWMVAKMSLSRLRCRTGRTERNRTGKAL